MPFPSEGRPALFILITFYVVGLSLALGLGFTIPPLVWIGTLTPALLIFASALSYRQGWNFLTTWLGANAIVYGQALPVMFMLVSLASFSFPWADSRLAAIDAMMGFHAPELLFALKPGLKVIWIGYTSMAVQPSLILLLLAVSDRSRCWEYVTAGVVAMAFTCAIFTFFPAAGTFRYFGILPNLYPPFSYDSPPYIFGHALELLRNGYRVADPAVMKGLVSFPSYHTVVAVLSVWAIWRIAVLRIPAILLNTALLAGCFVFGAHYLIDVIAGCAIAILSIIIANLLIKGRNFYNNEGS